MKPILVAVVLLSLPTLAGAQQAASAPAAITAPANPAATARPLTAEQQAFLTQEAALVRRLRLLDLQAAVAEKEKKLRGDDAPSGAGSSTSVDLPPIPPPIQRPGSVSSPVPQNAPMTMPSPPTAPPAFAVASVWGVDGRYVADLLVSGGMRVSVREGDALPSGWRVSKVLRTGVIITKGKERNTLMVGG